MKIAFIGQKGIPSVSGGVEKHVEELAVHLAKAGHEVMAYARHSYSPQTPREYKGVRLVSLPSLATKNLDAITHTFLACLDLLRRKVDIVHFHSIGPSSLIPLVRLLKPGVKIIATIHSQDYCQTKWGSFARFYLKLGERIACRFADETIVISRSLAEHVYKVYGTGSKYIPNGVSQPRFLKANLITRRWGLVKDDYILVVSRLIPNKGLHFLIKAYNLLASDKKLVIVGDSAYTDEYAESIRRQAATNPNIIFTGSLSGDILCELFSNARLFVHPSELEGMSIAVLEALSYGLTVLASDIRENVEALKGFGFTFRNRDCEDLCRVMADLISETKAPRQYSSVPNHLVEHDWELIARATEELYLSPRRQGSNVIWRQLCTRFATFL